ncbi:hypothetical protein LTR96_011220 [Exophiala xenobiotica]|nr:hypothetical protein LTR72_011320 [Exophiala xenobiotica]KAK5220223.1 hypothetical protein LTR47_011339 [Exophiala xenobiotica]KAK5244439.1 hypothetical protein LTS06_009986 [Exophiala xenobiotica]KAK5263370.1 hypothetical protein LTR96_011220 [Exophiala xenobiotica]KAK5282552.1 hypothetical protein LTR40_003133 [Exophiala xenobiotica]
MADSPPSSLDLTAASRAYLLEPQWNPMIEEQALSRIHRLGQTREVSTIRYRVRNSFEEKVAMIQDMKRDIAAGAFSSDSQVGVVNKSSRFQVGASNHRDPNMVLTLCGSRSSKMPFEDLAHDQHGGGYGHMNRVQTVQATIFHQRPNDVGSGFPETVAQDASMSLQDVLHVYWTYDYCDEG